MVESVKFSVRSETGRVRNNNEDNFFCNGIYMTPSERDKPFSLSGVAQTPCIFGVFDGMGGHDCGELASLTVAETLAEYAGKIRAGSHEDVDAFVKDANTKLLAVMRERGIKTGTTLAMAVFRENFFTVYNIGDSRVYSVKGGYLTRITEDHTLAAEMVRAGRLDPRRADDSRYSNMLTRFVGIDDEYEARPDVYALLGYDDNRRVLICSDGICKMLRHREIDAIIRAYPEDSDAVNFLVDAALKKGGVDNVTCIVLSFTEGIVPE